MSTCSSFLGEQNDSWSLPSRRQPAIRVSCISREFLKHWELGWSGDCYNRRSNVIVRFVNLAQEKKHWRGGSSQRKQWFHIKSTNNFESAIPAFSVCVLKELSSSKWASQAWGRRNFYCWQQAPAVSHYCPHEFGDNTSASFTRSTVRPFGQTV